MSESLEIRRAGDTPHSPFYIVGTRDVLEGLQDTIEAALLYPGTFYNETSFDPNGEEFDVYVKCLEE